MDRREQLLELLYVFFSYSIKLLVYNIYISNVDLFFIIHVGRTKDKNIKVSKVLPSYIQH